MLRAATVTLLERDGFAVLDHLLSSDEIDHLIDAISIHNPGHGLRNLLATVPAIRDLTNCDFVFDLLRPVTGPRLFPVRAIFFDKTIGANWKVIWHQDITIEVQKRVEVDGYGPWSVKEGVACVQPPSNVLERMVTLRIHLDACTADNGPLMVLPQSHVHGILSRDQIDHWRHTSTPIPSLTPKGGGMLMRPLLLHSSAQCIAPSHRRVIHIDFAAEPLPEPLRWKYSAPVRSDARGNL